MGEPRQSANREDFVSYAVRLGYSRTIAKAAVQALGRDASTNNLLQHVQRLHTESKKKEDDYWRRKQKRGRHTEVGHARSHLNLAISTSRDTLKFEVSRKSSKFRENSFSAEKSFNQPHTLISVSKLVGNSAFSLWCTLRRLV
eukprot:sb/3474096/